jgi:NAD(P)-dependent dehydrogenase (short-subunit alcohol dehydrogenase family)
MGLATAELLRDEGASVLVTGRTGADVETARRQFGDRVNVIASDATSLVDVAALGAHVEQRLGGVDAMFISAGISRSATVEETSEELYDEVFDVNVKGPYFTIQRLAPLMSEGSGIVLATSVSNVKGLPMNSVYAASKAALRSMARTFARELLPRGVRVNAVSPGPIDTGILDRSLPKDAAEATKAANARQQPDGTVRDTGGDRCRGRVPRIRGDVHHRRGTRRRRRRLTTPLSGRSITGRRDHQRRRHSRRQGHRHPTRAPGGKEPDIKRRSPTHGFSRSHPRRAPGRIRTCAPASGGQRSIP